MASKPAWLKRREAELRDANATEADLRQAQTDYEAAGLDLARVQGRGWRVFGMHPGRPQTFVQWGDLGIFIHDRERLIAEYREMCAADVSLGV